MTQFPATPLMSEPIPAGWDRRGLPAWTYHSEALFQLEREEIFLTHWQVAGHISDIPAPGDWLSFDLLGERAVVMRGADGVVRAFHNLCRLEGIIPALESSHALAYAAKLAPTLPKDKILLVNLSGRGDKDMHTVAEKSGITF